MRLYLLPISKSRTLLYAKRLHVVTASATNAGYLDRGVAFAAKTWAGWEKEKKGWKKKVVDWGNQAFRRIPYEEWGLKSVPPLSTRRKDNELTGSEKIELVFPEAIIPVTKAEGILRKLGTERQALHRGRLRWCIVGMPLSAPFALVPVIPNLPFFYLVYRAWSHWRALLGGKHIQWLVDNKIVLPAPSKELNQLYENNTLTNDDAADTEKLLISHEHVPKLSQILDIPELEVELDRAIWQVDTALKEKKNESPNVSGTATSDEKKPAEEEKTKS